MRCNRISLGVLVVCFLCSAAGAEPPASAGHPPLFRATHMPPLLALGGPRAAASASGQRMAASAEGKAESSRHIAEWRSFDVPGAAGTVPTGINDLGEITGFYLDANADEHGFIRKASGRIITFDAPNVGYPFAYSGTTPNDINNQGDVVGYFTDPNPNGQYHGFVRSARGKFTIIDDPSSDSSPPATLAQAMNDWGIVVGYWYDASNNYHGFVRHIDGSFTTVEPPGAVYSQAYHLNNAGEVGGDWTDAVTNTSHGMLLHRSGKLVTFDAPHAATTFGGLGQALNLEGTFTGTYADANNGAHGYVRYANGKFSEFTLPGGGTTNFNGTWGVSINLLGTVVGFSVQSDGATGDGYVRFADGTLVLADSPDQPSTFAWSINDLNEFTGYTIDVSGAPHGFVAVAVP